MSRKEGISTCLTTGGPLAPPIYPHFIVTKPARAICPSQSLKSSSQFLGFHLNKKIETMKLNV